MDEEVDLVVLTSMSQCIVKLAEVHDKVSDKGMKDIVHDAALTCLRMMASPEDEDRGVLMSLDGGKMQ
tara:strand:- start:571 stop:774 length:204 start_codon:yes stop_codon:yes gene_type:complete